MKPLNTIRALRTFVHAVAVALLTLVLGAGAAFAQEIHVDASNGSNLNDGTTKAKAVATIAKGLDLLNDGGTLVIYGDNYDLGGDLVIANTSNAANNLKSLNIRFEVGTQNFVALQNGRMMFNVTGAVGISAVGGAYAELASAIGTDDLRLGDAQAGNVSLDAAGTFRLADGAELTVTGNGRFTGFAPQKSTNLSIDFNVGAGAQAAGVIASQYTDLGNGSVTIVSVGAFTYGGGFTTTGDVIYNVPSGLTINGSVTAATFNGVAAGNVTFSAGSDLTTTGNVFSLGGAITVDDLTVGGDLLKAAGNLSASKISVTGTTSNIAGDVTTTGDATFTGAFTKTAGLLSVGGKAEFKAAATFSAGTNTFTGNLITNGVTQAAGATTVGVSLMVKTADVVIFGGTFTVTGVTTLDDKAIVNNGSGAVTLAAVNMSGAANTYGLDLNSAASGSITAGAVTITIADNSANVTIEPFVSNANADGAFMTVGNVTLTTTKPTTDATITLDIANGDAAGDLSELTIGNFSMADVKDGIFTHSYIVGNVSNTGGGDMKIGNATTMTGVVTNAEGGKLTMGTVTTLTGDITNTKGGTIETGVIAAMTGDVVNTAAGTVTTEVTKLTGDVNNNGGGTMTFSGEVTGAISNDAAASTLTIAKATSATGLFTNAGTGAGNGLVLNANLTLSGTEDHDFVGGTVSGTGKTILTNAGAITLVAGSGDLGAIDMNGDGGVNIVAAGAAAVVTADKVTIGGTGGLAIAAPGVGTVELDADTVMISKGAVNVTGTAAVATIDAGYLEVNAGTSLTVTPVAADAMLDLGSFRQVAGTVTMNPAVAAMSKMMVSGNFNRSTGTFTASGADAGSSLTFDGTTAQTFTPGPQLQIHDLNVTNSNAKVTFAQSVRANGDVTFIADTEVEFGSTSNLILNGDAQSFTVNGTYTTSAAVAGVYFGGVTGTGAVAVVGGTALPAGYTLAGEGVFGNLFVAVGNGNTLTFNSATTSAFTGDLNLVSGGFDINNAGAKFNPSGANARVVRTITDVGGAGTQGLTVTAGAFNDAKVAYDLVYEGSTGIASGPVTLPVSEFSADVDDVTFNVTSASPNQVVLPDADITINGNLTVSASSNLLTSATAARSITVKDTLSIAGTIGDGNTGVANVDIVLPTASGSHSITGSISDGANSNTLSITVTGSNTTIAGSGAYAAGKNIIDANVNVAASGVTISGVQEIQQPITVGTAAAAGGLTLRMIDRDLGGPATTGLVSAVTVGGANAGTFTLDSAVDINGLLDVKSNGTVALGVNNLTSSVVGLMIDSDVDATHTSTGGAYVAAAAGSFDFNNGSVPKVMISIVSSLDSDVKISNMLTVNAPLVGGKKITMLDGAELSMIANVANSVEMMGTTNTVILNGGDRMITGNLVQNKAGGTSTISADENVLTVTGNYTNTAGTLDVTDNTLNVVGDVTLTDGNIAMSTGRLTIDATAGNRAFSTNAKSATVKNLTIQAGANAVNMPVNSEVTVTTLNLISGNLNANNDGDVIIADNGTIFRTGGINTGSLSDIPTFGSTVNLVYTGTSLATGSEVPSDGSVLGNMNVSVLGILTVSSTTTVNGTLSLVVGAVDEAGATQLSFATGSTIIVQDGSLTDPASFAGQYNVIYVADNTTGFEMGGNPDVTVDDSSPGTITLTAVGAQNFNSITLGASDRYDLGANTLTTTGDLNFGSGSVDLSNSTVVFAGSAAQTLTVPSGVTNITDLVLNNSNGITLAGGDLSVSNQVDFRNGVFNLGGNDLRLVQSHNGALQPTQGFTRANLVAGGKSHIANGTVTKFIAADENVNAAAARSNVEFPVGTLNPNYRPLIFYFTDMDASINLSVGHSSTSPGGTLNLENIGVDKYPDFHWTVESDVSLREGQQYEVQARADGYLAENFNIDEVALINRSAGDPTKNNWRKMADVYDNDFTEDNYPVVRAVDASGSIRNTQQLFTFGLPQDIVYANPIAAQQVTVGGNVVVVADLDDVFTSNSALTFALAGDNPAAVNVALDGDNVLSINGVEATDGAVTLTVEANDGFATVSGTFEVTVNAAPTVASEVADQNLTLTQAPLVIDASGVFAGGTGDKAIAVVSADPAVVTAAAAGTDITLTPVAEGADVEVTVTGTDANGVAVSDIFLVSVTKATSLTGAIADQQLTVGGTAFSSDISTAFADGVAPVAYAAAVTAGTSVTVAIEGSTITVTAVEAGLSTVEYSATDANGVTSTDTFDVTVNAAPTATGIADFVIDAIDPAAVFTLGADFTFAGGTGALTVSDPTVDNAAVASATWDVGAGTLTIDGLSAGVANVTLSATDANDATVSFTVKVTVTANPTAPVWTAKLSDLAPLTINAAEEFTFTYAATSADGFDVTYEFYGTIPTNATLNEATGALSWTPESDGDFVISVQAVNSVDNTLIVKDQTIVTVLPAPVAPTFSASLATQTVNSGDVVEFTYVAGTPDAGVTIANYALANNYGGAATLNAATGEFTFTQDIQNPGDYVIDVTATDSRGLTVTTSATITVQMAIPFGDATGNGAVNATDAVAILRFVVGLPDSDIVGDRLYVADVSDNGVVNALDAALILRKLVDDSYVFPAEGGAGKEVAGVASLGWELTNASSAENLEVTLGLKDQVRGINAITYTVNYDAATVRVGDVNGTLPLGWIMQHHDDGEGTVRIAMVGVNAINDPSELVTVTFEQTGASSINAITATGFINDESVQEMDELELKVIPSEFALSQNYPNPFNPSTNISYQLPAETMVNITIYNLVGQKVATLVNEVKPAGVHIVNLDMSSFSSGSYIYRIQAGSFTSTKTMMLIK